MSEPQWTKEQRLCFEADLGPLLISAAAGSGKTAVLVRRVIRLLTDREHPVDADRLLVMTFTRAAAAEMKQRIYRKLTEMLADDPGNALLRRQITLLPAASIGTVDSFCTTLLREHAGQLGLSADFRVADEAQEAMLREQALQQTIEAFHEAGDPAFIELAELFSSDRDDTTLSETIDKLYLFTRSHPHPDRWLTEKQAVFENAPNAVESTVWGQLLTERARQFLHSADRRLIQASQKCRDFDILTEKYAPSVEALRLQLPTLLDGDWDTRQQRLCTLSFPALAPIRTPKGEAPDVALIEAKEEVKLLYGLAKEAISRAAELLTDTADECREDIAVSARLTKALTAAVRELDRRYTQEKRRRRLLDFSDVEHGALQLLIDENDAPTPLARELSLRFEEVLVDEYQDTNAAQDALFRALSRDEARLLTVGDVKQSIYGFRQAMPELFIRRRQAGVPYDGEHFPALICLSDNFRSRSTVTDAVNHVFGSLMPSYDSREALRASAPYPPGEGYETVLLNTQWSDPTDEFPDADSAEGAVIAEQIAAMVGRLPITVRGETRPLAYGDICILLRSHNKHAPAIAEALKARGIPACAASSLPFFRAAEIETAVALLRTIDNPTADIPLLTVLLCPIYGFSPDDLVCIRQQSRGNSLFADLSRMADQTGPLAQRCSDFLREMERYRLLAVSLPADALLYRLYEETGLPAVMSVRSDGSQRQQRLQRLYEMARRFENDGFRGLSSFVRYLNRLENQKSRDPATSFAPDQVSLMSIHGSKGLEYPVVFVAGLSHPFNRQDLHKNVVLDPEAGIGLKRRDAETLIRYATLPYRAVREVARQRMLEEEQRLLYVAMTRAKEKLILSVIGTDWDKTPPLPEEADCLGDWILSSVPDSGWSIENVTPSVVMAENTVLSVPVADPARTAEMSERFAYVYPYAALRALPAKLAASEAAAVGTVSRQYLSSRQLQKSTVSFPAAVRSLHGIGGQLTELSRPSFLEGEGLTPAERGTAHHLFMQLADYAHAAEDPRDEAARLVLRGSFTAEQAQALDMERLRRFFNSELYQRMCAADRVEREVSFTVRLPARDVFAHPPIGAEDEPILVQGMADCVIQENGHLVIVDYKTDRRVSAALLRRRYAPQLKLYALALQRVTGMPVAECLLYSFALDSTISVPFAEEQATS